MKDNETYQHTSDGEIHPGEVVEEKISLSERFGLWLSFYPPKQDEYLTIVGHWLKHFGCSDEDIAAARAGAGVGARTRFALGPCGLAIRPRLGRQARAPACRLTT